MTNDLNRIIEDADELDTAPVAPTVDVPPAPEEMNPNLIGVPLEFPEGAGAQREQEIEEQNQTSLKQVTRDTLSQSTINSAIEYLNDAPAAIEEWLDTGNADLEPLRDELTQGVPLHLHDEIMGSRTEVGARARRARLLEDMTEQNRIAEQTGLSRNAVAFAAGLLDADLPLIFASGGTVAAARTARKVAATTKALTGSTALARGAADLAVGVSGGAVSGAVVGGVGMMTRDDYDAVTMFQMIAAAAATGGAINPVVGRVLPDRDVWAKAAQIEQEALSKAEADIFRQAVDPEAPLHDNTPFVVLIDEAEGGLPQRSVGAAEVGATETDIVTDQIGLAGRAGVTQSIIDRSLASQKWRQDTAFKERFLEDTSNPLVRMLVGASDAKITLPIAQTEVPVGRLFGTVLTLAQRDFTLLINSKSPTANFVASEILESASGLGRRGSTSAVLREMFHSSALVHSAKPLRDFRAQYYRKRGVKNPLRMDNMRRFSGDLRIQMQNRYFGRTVDPEFEEIINRIDRTHNEILGHMQGIDEIRSVRGARDVEFRPGYFRYAWEPERFKAFLRSPDGEKNLIQAFKKGYMRASGLDEVLAGKIARAIIRRFNNRAMGIDSADSRLLDLDSRQGIEAILEQSDLTTKEVEDIMARLDANTQERSKKGYLKHRIEVDLSEPIPGTDSRLVDLMTDDFERTLQQYVGDASGAAALAHKGVRDKTDLDELRQTILAEQQALGENGLTSDQIDAILSQFAGTAHKGYIFGGQTKGITAVTSIFTKALRASLLQRVGLTQLMDSANLFVANGVARNMEPIMARLGISGPNKMSKADMVHLRDELDSIGVVVGQDHDIFAPHLSIDETELAENFLMSGAQRAMSSIERATYFVSGQIHVTKAQQIVAAAATSTNVISTIAGETTNLTNRKLRDIGLEPDIVADIRSLIDDGVIEVDGSKIKLNTSQWSPETRLEFGAAMMRATHQQAQKGMVGETSVWMNTDIGKILSALKTFSLVATQKQMARNLMIGGEPHFLAASVWQLGFAYAVLSLSHGIQGTSMDPSDRAWLAAAYTPNIGAIPMLVDPMTSMLGFDDLNFSPYGRYASYLDTPVFETTARLMQAPGAIGDMLSGEGTYQDQQNARAMFFLNWYGMKRVWEAM